MASREGFNAMLERLLSNGFKTVLVETASRFARDLSVQLTGHQMLKDHGIELIACDAPDHFPDDPPTATMVRQILGAVAEFQKSELVAKLAGARARKAAATGKPCGGRKSLTDLDPTLRGVAREAYRKPRGKPRPSLRQVAAKLASLGYTTAKGNAFSAAQAKRLAA